MAASMVANREKSSLAGSAQRNKDRLGLTGLMVQAASLGLARAVNGGESRRQTDESVRQAMYLTCWNPS
jgi:Wound-induced protein